MTPQQSEGRDTFLTRAIAGSEQPIPIGIKFERGEYQTDAYTGSAELLFAVGLASEHELPGPATGAKRRTSFNPNGSRQLRGSCAKNEQGPYAPGYRSITKLTDKYRVEITVCHEEQERRTAVFREKIQLDRQKVADERAIAIKNEEKWATIEKAKGAIEHITREEMQHLQQLTLSDIELGRLRRAELSELLMNIRTRKVSYLEDIALLEGRPPRGTGRPVLKLVHSNHTGAT
jgi:hypothetical protein